ncbi:MAG TPA: hypothetical protein VFE62_07015 [Gemmataceae bacterium]|nr:hypothetical protein [Gemmataceae bacterium]
MVDGINLILQSVVNAHSDHDRQHVSEALSGHLRQLEHELTFTKNALCDLIDILQKTQVMTPEMQAIIDCYDSQLSRLAHVDTTVETIVAKIDDFLARGKDIEAVRCYHTEAGAIWDRCHDVIGAWPMMSLSAKHYAVTVDVKRSRSTTPPPVEPSDS